MLKWKIVSVSLFNYYFDFALYKYAISMYAAEPHSYCMFYYPPTTKAMQQPTMPAYDTISHMLLSNTAI